MTTWNLPGKLDLTSISTEAFLNRALTTNNLNSLTHDGVRALLESDIQLNSAQRHSILGRYRLTPDIPGLYELIRTDLEDTEYRSTFGESHAHKALTLDQLSDLRRAIPGLIDQEEYVHTVVSKLHPPTSLPTCGSPAAQETRKAYLDATLDFVLLLEPTFNSLKAHLLFHRLKFDESAGTRDLDRFLSYLALPRPSQNASQAYIASNRSLPQAELLEDFRDVTGMPSVDSDSALIRTLLIHFLQSERSTERFTKFFTEDYLRPLHAEARLLAGKDKPEDFINAFTPTQFANLRDRIDLEFAPDAPTAFTPDDKVVLPLLIKNVPHIDVRIFELDPLAIYEATGEEIEPQIDLSGLAPTAEFRIESTAKSPFERQRITPDFPDLLAPGKRGIWVIDVVGAGRSCRALVRKGQLFLTSVESTAAGQELTFSDASGKPVSPAQIRLSGAAFKTKEGTENTLVPYTTSPGKKPIVLIDPSDGFASLATFEHIAEAPTLGLQIQSAPSSLVPGLRGSISIVPALTIGNNPAPLGICSALTLSVSGGDTSLSIPLDPDTFPTAGATSHANFDVPANANELTFKLDAELELASTGETIQLSSTQEIDLSPEGADVAPEPFLVPEDDGTYTLLLVGRNFEPYPNRNARIDFSHFVSDNKSQGHNLRTDAEGKIPLGTLTGILAIEINHSIIPIDPTYQITYPKEIITEAGMRLSIPRVPNTSATLLSIGILGASSSLPKSLKTDSNTFQIEGLPTGDYDLQIAGGIQPSRTIRIRVASNSDTLSTHTLPASSIPTLAFDKAEFSENGDLTIEMEGVTPLTELSFTTASFIERKQTIRPATKIAQELPRPLPTCRFLSGRKLGGEERYVLDRRSLTAFAGSLAPLPGILINPWVIAESQAKAQEASYAKDWDEEKIADGMVMEPSLNRSKWRKLASARGFREDGSFAGNNISPNLRFLAESTPSGSGFRPDADGKLTIKASDLGSGSVVTIYGIDPSNGSSVSLRLKRKATVPKTRDLRLAKPLSEKPVARKFTERPIAVGETLTFPDALSANPKLTFTVAEFFEDLAVSVPAIAPFRILGRWDKLDSKEKQLTYDRLASHELHLFLSRKDPKFFKSIVVPYLRNKLQKTFIDLYLLGSDLIIFHEPANYERLNAAEKALLAQRSPEHREAIARKLAEEQAHLKEMDFARQSRKSERTLQKSQFFAEAYSADARCIEVEKFGEPTPEDTERLNRLKADRSENQRLYQVVDTTKEWAESNYFQCKHSHSSSDIIRAGDFWIDLAEHASERPFLSAKLGGTTTSLHSALFALALNQLPFSTGEKSISENSISCATPFLARYLADSPLEDTGDAAPLTLRQAILNPDQKTAIVSGTPLVAGVQYSLLTVVTNSTPDKLAGEVVTQIPTGAIATSGNTIQTQRLHFEPFSSTQLTLDFYFPVAGDFEIPAAHAFNDTKHLGSSKAHPVKVLLEAPAPDPNSWPQVAANRSPAAILAFLEEAKLSETDLSLVAWRARTDAGFFDNIISLLEKRHIYNSDIYRYSLEHTPLRKVALANYLRRSPSMLYEAGTALKTAIYSITPFSSHEGELEDFFPLVPARAHTLDGTPTITSPAFHSYYHRLLEEMAELPERTGQDHLVLSAAMLAQRRIADAIEQLLMIPMDDAVAGTVQFAYLRAVIALHQADGEMARTVAGQYSDHPIKRWRERFNTVLAHAGGTPDAGETPEASQDAIADELPSLAFTELTLKHQNTTSAMLHIHEMDVELLFSAAPFLDSGDAGKRFRTIRPTVTIPLKFDAAFGTQEVVLPEEFDGKDIHITVTSGSASATTTRLRNRFDIAVTPTYGRLQVTAGSVAIPKVYVKAYARHEDGTVRFHKDGNTDLRGKFDYATTTDLSASGSPVTGYALLVLSDSHGAKILQVAPPTN